MLPTPLHAISIAAPSPAFRLSQVTPQPPAAPQAPPQPAPLETPAFATGVAGPSIQVPGMAPIVPMTQEQVDALARRSSRLSDQLSSAQDRRDDVARELENASTSTNRSGLEDRLRFLDERILSLEKEVGETSQARASLEANYSATAVAETGGKSSITIGPVSLTFAFLVLFPISLAIARSIWRRTSRRAEQAAQPLADARFAQLEQAIDTVAVEIERVAEGQRFVTRLLREGQPIPDFGGGQASADAVSVRSRPEETR